MSSTDRGRLWQRRSTLIASLFALVAITLGAFYAGARFGRYFERFSDLGLPTGQLTAKVSLFELLGLQKHYGQFDQDLLVTLVYAPGKREGFYVDVGSADGVINSNTKLLDEMGWKGVCIDPFPSSMDKRTCQMFTQPVSSEGGKAISFQAAGELGGIVDHLGAHKDRASKAKTVELVTTTLDEILAKSHAPKYIDYMSIDIEGAEFDALLGMSLDRYRVGLFTIEHNFEEVKRERIRELLEKYGYARIRAWRVDDWYAPAEIASKLPALVGR